MKKINVVLRKRTTTICLLYSIRDEAHLMVEPPHIIPLDQLNTCQQNMQACSQSVPPSGGLSGADQVSTESTPTTDTTSGQVQA